MSLPGSQRRALDRIEHNLAAEDPGLGMRFAFFTMLTREEAMPENERVPGHWERVVRRTVLLPLLTVGLVALVAAGWLAHSGRRARPACMRPPPERGRRRAPCGASPVPPASLPRSLCADLAALAVNRGLADTSRCPATGVRRGRSARRSRSRGATVGAVIRIVLTSEQSLRTSVVMAFANCERRRDTRSFSCTDSCHESSPPIPPESLRRLRGRRGASRRCRSTVSLASAHTRRRGDGGAVCKRHDRPGVRPALRWSLARMRDSG